MKKYMAGIFVMVLIGFFAVAASAQESEKAAQAPSSGQEATSEMPPAGDETMQPTDLSIYGEVQSVDASAGSMSVQYYNYDTDEEKTITIMTNKDTKFENASSVGDIKKTDWADITYVIDGGKNLAKSVIVEKEEAAGEEAAAPQGPGQEEAPAE